MKTNTASLGRRTRRCFREQVWIEVERHQLSTLEKAHHELNEYLAYLMKRFDNMNTLLVFYYVGHGFHVNDLDTVKLRACVCQSQHYGSC
jgi:hypothetical protein